MKISNVTKLLLLLLMSITVAACGAKRTFHEFARAGDTVAIGTGWQPTFNKDNITVTIYPSSGSPIPLAANDPAIKAIVNFYPDPVSSAFVSDLTGQDQTPAAQSYASSITFESGNSHDWYQTTVFLDLPSSLPTGLTNIVVDDGAGTFHALQLEIIPGTGQANIFDSDLAGPLSQDMMAVLERTSHFLVEFQSATLPDAIEINMAHNPDAANGGVGTAVAINSTGFNKALNWSDDGTNMKAILMPSSNTTINVIEDYKFYVAGGITGLIVSTVTGYDSNGNIIPGVTASITAN